ncbi:hypothetical protein H9L39_05316 [Fusarium oxysporum f. sp. albedinis]|jgi:hypothetical protein|nr:hypothetical protein H9L39_05316 [Fusarium oxysporum f. sp. albedinis]
MYHLGKEVSNLFFGADRAVERRKTGLEMALELLRSHLVPARHSLKRCLHCSLDQCFNDTMVIEKPWHSEPFAILDRLAKRLLREVKSMVELRFDSSSELE